MSKILAYYPTSRLLLKPPTDKGVVSEIAENFAPLPSSPAPRPPRPKKK